jgi:hypothetical protein
MQHFTVSIRRLSVVNLRGFEAPAAFELPKVLMTLLEATQTN